MRDAVNAPTKFKPFSLYGARVAFTSISTANNNLLKPQVRSVGRSYGADYDPTSFTHRLQEPLPSQGMHF